MPPRYFPVLLLATTLAQAEAELPSKPVSVDRSTQTSGIFSAQLICTDDSTRLKKLWESDAENVVLNLVDRIPLGRRLYSYVIYQGCTPDVRGKCSVSLRFKSRSPDGNTFTVSTTLPLKASPAPAGPALSYENDLRFDGDDPDGTYVIEARIIDHNSMTTFDLEKTIEVVGDGRARSQTQLLGREIGDIGIRIEEGPAPDRPKKSN